jgi:hypothetical protein
LLEIAGVLENSETIHPSFPLELTKKSFVQVEEREDGTRDPYVYKITPEDLSTHHLAVYVGFARDGKDVWTKEKSGHAPIILFTVPIG